MDYLSDDLNLDIASRLPLKMLGRLMCVSKTWQNLITSHPRMKFDGILIREEIYRAEVLHPVLVFRSDWRLRVPGKFDIALWLDYCNGLLLLWQRGPSKCYVVANPLTKQYVLVDKPTLRSRDKDYAVLAYDPNESKYFKIVRFETSRKLLVLPAYYDAGVMEHFPANPRRRRKHRQDRDADPVPNVLLQGSKNFYGIATREENCKATTLLRGINDWYRCNSDTKFQIPDAFGPKTKWLDYCNGLFLFWHRIDNSLPKNHYVVFNPLTKQYVAIDKPTSRSRDKDYAVLAYDSYRSNYFKIVRFESSTNLKVFFSETDFANYVLNSRTSQFIWVSVANDQFWKSRNLIGICDSYNLIRLSTMG
ncbi:hypothetical protein ACFE04_028791 [Oxalis oulophora]